MKKLAYIFSLMIISAFNSFSQEQYIEVVVKDTLLVEPQRWTLFITIVKSYDYNTTTVSTDTTMSDTVGYTTYPPLSALNRAPEDSTRDKVIALIKKYKGNWLDDPHKPNFSLRANRNSRSDDNYLNVEFTNRKAMEDFSVALNQLDNVNKQIFFTDHSDMEKFNAILDAKLINTAKQKAARLANLSGRKTGAIIMVSESTQGERNTLEGLIELFVKTGGREMFTEMFMNPVPDKIRMEKMIKVRFALL